MAEISNLSELPQGVNPTPDQIRELANRVLLTIHNLIYGNGTWGAVDEMENGEVGSSAYPSRTLPQLLKTHKYLMDLLDHPEMLDADEFQIYVSQFDNPYF